MPASWSWEEWGQPAGLVLTHIVNPSRDYHISVLLRLQGKKRKVS